MCLNQGRLVGQIRAVGGLRDGGGNCLKYLRRQWNRKEVRGNKDLKKGGTSWVKEWVLKKGGAATSSQTMVERTLRWPNTH